MTTSLVVLASAVVMLVLFVRWLEPRFAFFPFPGETETPAQYGVRFDALTVNTSDGERLRAWKLHASEPRALVVYFHGNGGNLSNWAPILSAIASHGYDVFAIDYRGYGLSTGRPSERGLYRDVEAAVAAARRVDTRLPVIYWGRSLGAAMAACAARSWEPDGVILEASFPNARAAVRSSPLLAAMALLSSYRFPTVEHMKYVRAPVLVLHGDRDSIIPYALGREVYDALPQRKQFVTIRGGDHNDASPADGEYWTAIETFVRSLPR
jgi:pimeloyl-ACP methyl ester carboxylesterase